MANIVARVINKLKRTFDPDIKHTAIKGVNTLRIGTDYGGWVIPLGLLNADSICYAAGAGEDISFDAGLAQKFGCHVWVIDPTPRAILHFNSMKESITKGERFPANEAVPAYAISKENLDLMHMVPVGLWDKHEFLKFYAPKNEEHVSHSIVNLQKTENYFEAEVKRLKDLMAENGHNHLDLLKIDIEGAEYTVVDTVLEDKLDVKVMCVEFDEFYNPLDKGYLKRINGAISKVKAAGYVLIDIDHAGNSTFLQKQLLDKVKG